jgi:hypothetical protein
VPCGLTATSYGNSPLATFLGVSGRSAPERSEAYWEISFVPPLPVTYTNGAPADNRPPPTTRPPPARLPPCTRPPARRPSPQPPRPPAAQTSTSRQAPFTAWLMHHRRLACPAHRDAATRSGSPGPAALTAPRTPQPRTCYGETGRTRGQDHHTDRSSGHRCTLPVNPPGSACMPCELDVSCPANDPSTRLPTPTCPGQHAVPD